MQLDMEKIRLDDLSHWIFDEFKTISVPFLSQHYEIPFDQCTKLLEKWLEVNDGKGKQFEKRVLLQGKSPEGKIHVGLAWEHNIPTALSKLQPKKQLWGVSLQSSNRHVPIVEQFDQVVLNIRLKDSQREMPKPRIQVIPPVAEKKPEVVIKQEKEPMNSHSPPDLLSFFPKTEPKEEPKKTSPSKTSPPKKDTKKKAAQSELSKNPIASFFARSQNKPKSQAVPTPVEPKKEVEPPQESKKRSMEDDEVVPETPEQRSKAKKFKPTKQAKTKAGKKLSRVVQIEDSSDEDDGPKQEEEKCIKYDDEDVEMPVESPKKKEKESSPKKEDAGPSTSGEGKKKRPKAKRYVTKTYEAEDGFIKTVRELEEYSVSEDEEEIPVKKPAPEVKKRPIKTETKSPAKTPTKKGPGRPSKKKSPAKGGLKQGNLLNFFTKK